MRTVVFFLSLIIGTFIIINSCKKDNNSTPSEKKSYAWIAGDIDSTGYGTILFSSDSGNTWSRQGLNSQPLLGLIVTDIWAVDEENVWAVGSNNTILKTNDGGLTWNKIQSPVTNQNIEFMSISVVNETNIWLSGSNGVVVNSTDNGNTWTLFDTTFFHSGGIQGSWAISPQKVYAVGGYGSGTERGFIGFTLDGGTTWDSVVPADNYNKNEWIGVTASGNTIVIYGGKSHYMVSFDNGTTWNNDSVAAGGGGGGADINHLIMLDSQTWWGALDMGHICYTKDGGTSWTLQQTDQGGEFLLGIDAWDNQLALAVGELAGYPPTGAIVKTTNGGNKWITVDTVKTHLYHVTFIKEQTY